MMNNDALHLGFQHLVGVLVGLVERHLPAVRQQQVNVHRIDESLAGQLGSHQLVQFLSRALQALGLGKCSGRGHRYQLTVHPAGLVGSPEPLTCI